jgi:hypothetical protein
MYTTVTIQRTRVQYTNHNACNNYFQTDWPNPIIIKITKVYVSLRAALTCICSQAATKFGSNTISL